MTLPPEALRAFPPLSQRCALRAGGRSQRGGAALARRPSPGTRQSHTLRVLHRLLALSVLLWSQAACAVDVNQASEAELDGVRGIGPGLSGRILQERARGPFAHWADLVARVGGIGPGTAARLSREGLTVNGEAWRAPAGKSRAQQPPPASGPQR